LQGIVSPYKQFGAEFIWILQLINNLVNQPIYIFEL
jgi:hypothetical protein